MVRISYVIRWRTGKGKGRQHTIEIKNKSQAKAKLNKITGSTGTHSVYFTKRKRR